MILAVFPACTNSLDDVIVISFSILYVVFVSIELKSYVPTNISITYFPFSSFNDSVLSFLIAAMASSNESYFVSFMRHKSTTFHFTTVLLPLATFFP